MRVKHLMIRRARRLPQVRVLCLSDHRRAESEPGESVADPILFDAGHLDQTDLRRDLGMSEDRYYFTAIGAITARKNLPMIFRSVLKLADAKAGLLVCGQLDDLTREAIVPLLDEAERLGVSVVVNDRLHSNHELNRAVQAADCVVTAYDNSAPNSSMTKAARAGRRAVVVGTDRVQMWARNVGVELTGPLDQTTLDQLLRRATSMPLPPPIPDEDHRAFADSFLC
jgi:hypothetical protein